MRRPSHVVEDQSEAIAFLADPRSHGGASVTRVDTHGAVVILVGERALKLKRAVRFPYMDFSTVELRRRACEAEVRLNLRTAPRLYLGAQPIVRAASGALAVGGVGETVDWVVVMRRFDQSLLFDRLAKRGALDANLMTELTDAILRFHESAERRPDQGNAADFARVIADNDQGLREAGECFPPDAVARLRTTSDAALERVRPLLESRRVRGLVRHCHGDLHLRNICSIDGRPVLFDAIEFNERLSCIDVLYDLAFLLMDLDRLGLRKFANLVLNRYFSEGTRFDGLGDLSGLATLPLFLSARAAVRAVVGVAMASAQSDALASRQLLAEVKPYLGLALQYAAPHAPRLVAIGGLSGSGKSTLAREAAPSIDPAPGAIVLRSDVIRKQLIGVAPLERLGPEAYTAEITERVYTTLAVRAREALAAGHAVVTDAVYARPEERRSIEAVASGCGVRFDGLWLEAPSEVLTSRITGRHNDASDATVAVLHRQLQYSLGPMRWGKIDVGGTLPEALELVRSRLGIAGATH
ncbi:MAG TPA: AAA family ATPase [Alphaproteobacteria bacterium]|nr:AAA family ATPase [Alphaproteobacteria bacterium]